MPPNQLCNYVSALAPARQDGRNLRPALAIQTRAALLDSLPCYLSSAVLLNEVILFNSVSISSGSGKMIVVFFSTPISVSVCR